MKRAPIIQTVIVTNPTRYDPAYRRYLQTWARIGRTGVLVLVDAKEVSNG